MKAPPPMKRLYDQRTQDGPPDLNLALTFKTSLVLKTKKERVYVIKVISDT